MTKTGIRPPAPDAAKAKCCECSANYSDGRRIDCQHLNCPMYCKMPYRSHKPNYLWIFGKWTKTHDKKRRALGLTQEQYIAMYIVKPNGKNTLGYNALFRTKCYRCCGDFYDGRVDCEIIDCPIYYWMPYRQLEPDLNWLFDLPYTKKHENKRKFERLTREEYIAKYIAKSDVEIEDDEDEPIIKVRKVRALA